MIARIFASFVFVLVFLTVLGHACELPIELAFVAHAHEDAHDASDHHADDSQVDCDAVPAVQPNTHASANVDLAVHAGPHPVLDTVALHVVIAPPDSYAKRRRPPLCLMHAALLI